MGKPLEGVRVLDIGTLLAGPWGATLLGDFGAEIIKVEQPETGDALRGTPTNGEAGNPLHWLIDARNKKSVTLNLRKAEGQALLKDLVKKSDILFENFTPGTLEKWDLGWDELKIINPRLIMVRVSGYGQTGPYAKRPGYDRIALGFSGYMYPTGFADRYPVRPAFPTADYNTATFGAYAAMLALYERDANGGDGQMIDLALYEPPFRITSSLVAGWQKHGRNRERVGNRNPGFAPAGTFMTADGRYVQIAAGGDNVWRRFAELIGGDELVQDARYRRSRDRVEKADELEERVGEWVGARTFDEVEALLVAAGVPVGGIYRAQDIAQDPHYQARSSLIEVQDAEQGPVSMPGIVPKLSDTPGEVAWTGPKLGAHNEEIYRDLLGKSTEEMVALSERGVI
ncbi:MAG: CoA transferase [Pseudomonadota bacterium]|nr:CoA transferase [Pseudomonadota bacterium]